MRIKTNRLMLTLGQRRLLRSVKMKRKVLHQLPTEPTGTTKVPKAMTGIQTPLLLKQETACRLRLILEDQVILEQQMIQRMQELTTICSASLKRK